MKFGQLIEYNERKTFPEKSYTKWIWESTSRPFSKNSKLCISLDQYIKSFIYFGFIVCQVDGTCFYLI